MEASLTGEEEMMAENIAPAATTTTTHKKQTPRPEALLQTNFVLEKQLQEFETQLDQLLSHNDEDEEEVANNGNLRRKLAFLRTLLVMEMELHPETMPEHLLCLTSKLEFLEDAFNNRVENFSIDDHHRLEGSSPCSCTKSCFEEEEKPVESDENDPGLVEAQPVLVKEPGDRKSEERRRERRTCKKHLAGVSVALLLLMPAIGIAMSWWFHEEELFLVPT